MFAKIGRAFSASPRAERPRLSVLVTSFTYRCFANWEPVFHRLRDQGHRVHTALFPRLSDPDHARLLRLPFDNVLRCPIDAQFRTVGQSEETVLARLAGWAADEEPDLVWLCTFHQGPERLLRQRLASLPFPPLIVGLQHGIWHDWQLFEAWADRFDLLGAFGRFFFDQCSPALARRMVVMGLPKLDAVAAPPRGGPIRRILFAAQNEPSVAKMETLLRAVAADLDAKIVVRPHPEHREAFRPLFGGFAVNSPDEPLRAALDSADAMITTGSTAAVEGLAAGLRVAVLPCQGGTVYEQAGIVASSLGAADVVAVLRRYDDPAFHAGIRRFLAAATGAADGGRTDMALAAIDRLVARRRSHGARPSRAGILHELREFGSRRRHGERGRAN